MEATLQSFHVRQFDGCFWNEVGEMSEMEIYGHVRTRLGDDAPAAEGALRQLETNGTAIVYFRNSFGQECRMEIRRL